MGERLRQLDEQLNLLPEEMGVSDVVIQIDLARRTARQLQKSDPEEAKKFTQVSKRLEEIHAKKMEPYKTKRAEIKRNIGRIERSAYGIQREIQDLERAIEANEESLVSSLRVFERNAHQYLTRQRDFTPKRKAEELNKLSAEVERVEGLMEAEAARVAANLPPGASIPLEAQRHVESRMAKAKSLEEKMEVIEEGAFEERTAKLEKKLQEARERIKNCLLYTSPSPRDS